MSCMENSLINIMIPYAIIPYLERKGNRRNWICNDNERYNVMMSIAINSVKFTKRYLNKVHRFACVDFVQS